ncbi:MAG: porin family protein [Bacteroidota bacterium]
MNWRLIFFLLLGLVSANASAQILIGPTVGPNFSWTNFDDEDLKDYYSIRPVAGFHGGVMVQFRVQKRFFLNTSLIYSTKGKIARTDNDQLFRNQVTYQYLEMPILYTAEFKGTVGGNREYKWYFGAGPNVSYWLGGKGRMMSTDLNELAIDELSYKIALGKDPEMTAANEMSVQDPNRMQLGLNLAAGFVFEPMGYQKFMILFRYELGHSFLSRTTDGVFAGIAYQEPMRVRNHGLRISLSYLMDTKISERKKGKSTIKHSGRKRR